MVVWLCKMFLMHWICRILLGKKSYHIFCIFMHRKSSLCTYCRTGTHRFLKLLRFSSLLGWCWHWLIMEHSVDWWSPLLPQWTNWHPQLLNLSKGNPSCYSGVTLAFGKVTLWYGLRATFIIRGYFLEEITAYEIQTSYITGQRYHDILRNFVVP